MNSKRISVMLGLMLMGSSAAFAAQAAMDSSVPVYSRYYDYVNKLRADNFIDMPALKRGQTITRLDMAKIVVAAESSNKKMPGYLRFYVNEMAKEFAPEIAYVNENAATGEITKPMAAATATAAAPVATKAVAASASTAKAPASQYIKPVATKTKPVKAVAKLKTSLKPVEHVKAPITADVPLDSRYYDYADKLGAMNVAETPEFKTRPYSRLDMAKVVISAMNSKKDIPGYLQTYIDEMQAEFAPEIGYVLGDNTKLENFKLREGSLQIGYYGADKYKYSLKTADGDHNVNASYQPGVSNNNGHYYGNGTNLIAGVTASGSINKDLAAGVNARASYDKDNKAAAAFDELYAKTRIGGNVALTVGRQPQLWGGAGYNDAFALSNNARPQTVLKFSLIQPHGFNNGFLKGLRKGNLNVFLSSLEKNRTERAIGAYGAGANEYDKAYLFGFRGEVAPFKWWNLSAEYLNMKYEFGSKWLPQGDSNTDVNDQIAGVTTKFTLPGVHLYGSYFGETIHNLQLQNPATSAGVYFPALTKDGKNDLRLEYATTNESWYRHGTFMNGWTYFDSIIGSAMGQDAKRFKAEVTHYFDNGNTLALGYVNSEMERNIANPVKTNLFRLIYTAKLKKNLELAAILGFGKLKNYDHVAGNDKNVNLFAVTLKKKF